MQKLIVLSWLVLLFTACSSCSAQKENAVAYNQSLVNVVEHVDSLRNAIGSKENETPQETLKKLQALKAGLKNMSEKLDGINQHSSDKNFLESVKQYVRENEDLMKKELVLIAQVKDKVLLGDVHQEEIDYALHLNEVVNHRIDSLTTIIQQAQNDFSRRARLNLE